MDASQHTFDCDKYVFSFYCHFTARSCFLFSLRKKSMLLVLYIVLFMLVNSSMCWIFLCIIIEEVKGRSMENKNFSYAYKTE